MTLHPKPSTRSCFTTPCMSEARGRFTPRRTVTLLQPMHRDIRAIVGDPSADE